MEDIPRVKRATFHVLKTYHEKWNRTMKGI